MEILRDQYGDPCSIPDDAFVTYGKPLSEWLNKEPKCHGLPVFIPNWFEQRQELAQRAVNLIAEVRGYKNATIENCAIFLRFEPYVVEHYRIDIKARYGSICPLTYYFVFKEDNNGNTFVVSETIEHPLYDAT